MAIELVDKFFDYVNCWNDEGDADYNKAYEYAKRCALISVILVISSNPHSNPFNTTGYSTMGYWNQVKQEIEKL